MRTHYFDFEDIELKNGFFCSGSGSFEYFIHERERDSPDDYECAMADEDTVKILSVTITDDDDEVSIYNKSTINKQVSDDVIAALWDNYVIDSELDNLYDGLD